jgi:arylsulfatase A-like enzyme/Flp pilus assembly protein TadD
VVSCLSCSTDSKTGPETSAPPKLRRDTNILLITVDTLRADHLGCYGYRNASTPNIDALAKRGVRFTQAFAHVPLTTPSHASILTGAYPQVHQLRDNGGFVLDDSIPTLATAAQQAGFETAAVIGAAVLHHQYGLNRGFGTYLDSMQVPKRQGLLPGVVAEVRADVVTQRALEWLQKQRASGFGTTAGKNFLLWAHYYDPHFPYDPPGPFASRFSKDKYSGEIAYTDEQIGKLISGLADLGMKDRTLVLLVSDHGEGLGDHGEFTHGVFLYDEATHIPMIATGPDILPGRVIERQVASIDVMPTILDYLGLPTGKQVQGHSLLASLLEGKPPAEQFTYMETLYPKTSHGWSELRAVRVPGWKFIMAPTPELYDLRSDPGENQNLNTANPSKARELEKHVWEIAGPRESLGQLDRKPVNSQTLHELQSLGYASGGSRRDLRIDLSGPDPKQRISILKALDQAAAYMNADRFAAAVPVLERASAEDPTNPAVYNHLGICYQRLRQFQKAAQTYQRAVQHDADTDQIHAELGEVHVRMGKLPDGVNAMERAAEMNLTNLQNLANLATAYLQMNRLADAEKTAKAILAQNARHAGAYNILGIVEIQRGQGNAARGYFEKAVQFDPTLTEPYLNLGLLAQNAGQSQVAVDYYKKFLARARPKDHGEYIPKVKAAIVELGGKL